MDLHIANINNTWDRTDMLSHINSFTDANIQLADIIQIKNNNDGKIFKVTVPENKVGAVLTIWAPSVTADLWRKTTFRGPATQSTGNSRRPRPHAQRRQPARPRPRPQRTYQENTRYYQETSRRGPSQHSNPGYTQGYHYQQYSPDYNQGYQYQQYSPDYNQGYRYQQPNPYNRDNQQDGPFTQPGSYYPEDREYYRGQQSNPLPRW